MHPIIALWVHPRSLSTAVERIMRERGDCTCFHEPFIYDYYVNRAVRRLPHFDIDPAAPTAFADIWAMLQRAAETAPVFFKDMSYYVVPDLLQEGAFARRISHSFLIRDPRKSILSYHKLDPEVTLEEIGLEAQWRHAVWLQETFGTEPLVIEAEAVQRDPRGTLGAYWARLGLPPAEQAFSWQAAAAPADWQQVAGWHAKASASSGIEPGPPEAETAADFAAAAARTPRLQRLLDHHRPFYERLKVWSVTG